MAEAHNGVETRTGPAPRRPPGRPRNPLAEQRILDAAIDEYLEHGSAGFTMDGVARRAGVGKSTVYLRWADRDSLLVESLCARSSSIEAVDTGSLHEDLVQLAANLLRHLLDPVGYATFRITVDAVANSAYQRVAVETARQHRDAARRVFERARVRGELADDSEVEPIIECLYGAISMKVLGKGIEPGLETDKDVDAASANTVNLIWPLLFIGKSNHSE